MMAPVWWIVGGVLLAAAAGRWLSRRSHARDEVDHGDQVERAFKAVHSGRREAIATAAEGPVQLRGKVSAKEATLVAPLSQRPCVFYNLRVHDLIPRELQNRWDDKAPPPVTSILRERCAHPFLITDETGSAEVTFEDAEDVSFIVPPHISLSGRRLLASTAISTALARLGVALTAPLAVSEEAIFVGETVTVAGVGTREMASGGESAGYRGLPVRYVVRAGPTAVLAVLKRKQ